LLGYLNWLLLIFVGAALESSFFSRFLWSVCRTLSLGFIKHLLIQKKKKTQNFTS